MTCEKLAVTNSLAIPLNALAMNLEKLLELLFVIYAYSLALLTINGASRSSQWMPLIDQSVPTLRITRKSSLLHTGCGESPCVNYSKSPSREEKSIKNDQVLECKTWSCYRLA